jgi:uncharacterized iron-regulated membrane protein
LPSGAGTVIRIRSWTRDASHDGARDEFRIDAITGRVISSEIYADKSIGERMLSNLLDIHRGSLWGWLGKLLFMLAAALMPLIVVTGFILYLSRRQHRRVSRPMLGDLAPGERGIGSAAEMRFAQKAPNSRQMLPTRQLCPTPRTGIFNLNC